VVVAVANLVAAKRSLMKITRYQLRKIIRESLEEKYGKDYLSKTHTGGEGEEEDPELDFTKEELDEGEAQDIDYWYQVGRKTKH